VIFKIWSKSILKRGWVMKRLELVVRNTWRRDIVRYIARIAPDEMRELDVQEGNFLRLEGARTTTAIAWPQRPSDTKIGTISVDGRIRINARTSLSEKVYVSKEKPERAKRIELVSLEPDLIGRKPDQINRSDLADVAKWGLVNCPVMKEDMVIIPLPSGVLPFIVAEAYPTGAVVISESTRVEVVDIPIKDEWKAGLRATEQDVVEDV
jgi:transitional endoplasmic reticulum ATPase